MKITVLTLFPEMFTALGASILGRAQKAGKLQLEVVDIRDYTEDKHQKCDDYPFGGGAGMVMMAQPIGSAFEAVDPGHGARRIYLSPKGKVLKQERIFGLAEEEHLVLLCGHYEGVDQRAIDLFVDEELSIGDYVLTGGELPAMVLIDCVARYIDGVLSPGRKLTKTRDGASPTPTTTPLSSDETDVTAPPSSEKRPTTESHLRAASGETGSVISPEETVTTCPLTVTVTPESVSGDVSSITASRLTEASLTAGSVMTNESFPVPDESVASTREELS